MFLVFLLQALIIFLIIILLGFPVALLASKQYKNIESTERLVLAFIIGVLILTLEYIFLKIILIKLSRMVLLEATLTILLALYSYLCISHFKLNHVIHILKPISFFKYNIHELCLFFTFLTNLGFRIYYIAKAYPLFIGWDTPNYIRYSIQHIYEVPNYYPSSVPFNHSLLYFIAALFIVMFKNHHIVEILIATIDSFSVYPVYLMYKHVSKNKHIALLGSLMYSTSFFAFRFFSDLYRDVLANTFLIISLALIIKGVANYSPYFRYSYSLFSGLSLALAFLSHTDVIYRWVLYSYILIIVIFLFKRRLVVDVIKSFLISLVPLIITISLYQIYLQLTSSYSVLDRIYGGYKYALRAELNPQILTNAIPKHVLKKELFYILLGSIFLIRLNKIYGLWWIIITVILFLVSCMPHFGLYASKATLRIFYYYGLFGYLLKSTLLVSIPYLLIGTTCLTYSEYVHKHTRVMLLLTLIVVMSNSFAPFDVTSFYPLRRKVSPQVVLHHSKIGEPILTESQYLGLLFLNSTLKSVSRNFTLFVTTGRLCTYTSLILNLNFTQEITYSIPMFVPKNYLTIIRDIVSKDIINSTLFLNKCGIRIVYFLIDPSYSEGKDLLTNIMRRRWYFLNVYESNDILIFMYNVTKISLLFDKLLKETKIMAVFPNHTQVVLHLNYLEFSDFPYFSVTVYAKEVNLVDIPRYLIPSSITPSPLILTYSNNIMHIESDVTTNYTITFMSTFPFLDVKYILIPSTSFVKEEDVYVAIHKDYILVRSNRLYKGIIFTFTPPFNTKNLYLVIKYKVNHGLMDIYAINSTYHSKLLLSSREATSHLAIIELNNITNLKFLKIQGSTSTSEFLIMYMFIASIPPI